MNREVVLLAVSLPKEVADMKIVQVNGHRRKPQTDSKLSVNPPGAVSWEAVLNGRTVLVPQLQVSVRRP